MVCRLHFTGVRRPPKPWHAIFWQGCWSSKFAGKLDTIMVCTGKDEADMLLVLGISFLEAYIRSP